MKLTTPRWIYSFERTILLIYVGVNLIIDSYRRDPDQWLQRPLPIGGVGNHASRTAEKDAHCLHIIADNFIGGVDIKN